MYMTYHGGRCCGIKHIWGMANGPDAVLYPTEAMNSSTEAWSSHMYSHPRPKETAADRLDAMIALARMNWPQHIVEVVCADTSYQKQAQNWHDALVERGFKEVNRNINSNSTNTVVVYHLNVNDEKIPHPERLAAARELTPTIYAIDDKTQLYGKGEPLKSKIRAKPTPLPKAIEVLMDGHVMEVSPFGGDVVTPKQIKAKRPLKALA